MKKWILFLLIAIAFTSCQKIVPARQISRISFLSNRVEGKRNFDIYIMNADGSDQKNLTKSLSTVKSYSNPILSPDGRTILFVALEKAVTYLDLLNIQDLSVKRLTELNTKNPKASFSPDGQTIVYVDNTMGLQQIYLLNIESGKTTNISNNTSDEFEAHFFQKSKRIAYISKNESQHHIMVMDLKVYEKNIILSRNGKINSISISPNEEQIVFQTFEDKYSPFYIVDIKGEFLKKLSEEKTINLNPVFSPDSKFIIFISHQRGMSSRDICVINTEGFQFKNITFGLNNINQNPEISQDGRTIIFESVKFSTSDIYSYNFENEMIQNLTEQSGWNHSPSIY